MIVKIITLLVFLHLAGCSLVPHILYKIDVQQGNVVDDEMLEKLKPDMTKSQVRFVLGTPLVVDPFRNNRWDYVYIQREKDELVEQKRLTVYFEDERLIRIEDEQLYLLQAVDANQPRTQPESELGSEPEPEPESASIGLEPETVQEDE